MYAKDYKKGKTKFSPAVVEQIVRDPERVVTSFPCEHDEMACSCKEAAEKKGYKGAELE